MNDTTSLYTLGEEEEDILKELVNISFGLSASLIADMVNAHANLHLPSLKIISIDELDKAINFNHNNEKSYYVTTQTFRTRFSGETLFVMDQLSGYELAKMVMSDDMLENDEENIKSIIMEVANIITSSAIGKICEILEEKALFEAPFVETRSNESIIEKNLYSNYSKVIILYTCLDLPERNIIGSMYIMINDTLFEWLKKALGTLL